MRIAVLSALSILALASPALAAAPNLSVTLPQPAPTPSVYGSATYTVNVANIGNQDAAGVQLTIQLPKTGTSPQVYIMGNLGTFDGRCALGGASGTVAGTKLVCNLGTVKRNKNTNVAFNLALPEKTGSLVIDASATTTTPGDPNPMNDLASLNAALVYYTWAIDTSPTTIYTASHCTGTGLTAYFECTKFPSSITSHQQQFVGGPASGTITIPGQPSYGGTWAVAGDTLTFVITDNSGPVPVPAAEFSGRGVQTTGCFEGLTRFPDGLGGYSTYVSPYRVCP